MRRTAAFVTPLVAGLLIAACGGSAALPVPAKPENTPSPTVTATPGLVLLDISVRDSHQSQAFTAPGSWDVNWEVRGDLNSSPGAVVSAILMDTHGAPIAQVFSATVDTGGQKSDVTHMHIAGTFYVQIDGFGAWQIKAVTT